MPDLLFSRPPQESGVFLYRSKKAFYGLARRRSISQQFQQQIGTGRCVLVAGRSRKRDEIFFSTPRVNDLMTARLSRHGASKPTFLSAYFRRIARVYTSEDGVPANSLSRETENGSLPRRDLRETRNRIASSSRIGLKNSEVGSSSPHNAR